MQRETRRMLVIWVVALAANISAAIFLPNAEADGYSYAEEIAQHTAQISSGHFQLTDLYGFWLPLFQLAVTLPNLLIGNALLSGKLLSAICGATSCVFIFLITRQITRSDLLASVAFMLMLLNPLHLLYAASSMTDVPCECFVLASLWAVINQRWTLAAVFVALAEGIRIEPWSLLILLPVLQFLYERRISIRAVAILAVPPLAWLVISGIATGNPFSFFADRAHYQSAYLEFYPSRRGFALADIQRDIAYFLLGANRIVVLAILVAGGLSILWLARRRAVPISVFAPLAYAATLFSFLLVAYITKQQPVVFPRYALTIFALGLPLFLWLAKFSIIRWPQSKAVTLIVIVAVALCVREMKAQLIVGFDVLSDFHSREKIAAALAAAFQKDGRAEERCFSDDPAVRVLSRLPVDRFIRSATAPAFAHVSQSAFEAYLQQQHPAYLVFTAVENSLPAKFFPELGRNENQARFQLISSASSPYTSDVRLYRLRD